LAYFSIFVLLKVFVKKCRAENEKKAMKFSVIKTLYSSLQLEFQHLNLQIHNATKRRQTYKSNSSFSKSDDYVESGNSKDRHSLGKA